MKKSIALGVLAIAVAAQAQNYKVTVSIPDEDMDGAMAFIVDYDNGNKIDSVQVADNMAVFSGTIDAPAVVRLTVDGNRMAQFILEPGDLTVDPGTRKVTGGRLNDINAGLQKQAAEYSTLYKAAQTDAERQDILAKYEAFMDKAMTDNIDNPIGYQIFLQQAYDMTPEQLVAFVNDHPSVTKYQRVNKLLQANRNKAATQPGAKFADFTIEYDGQKHSLSDVVGKGDYVLVDFWASWCGPCIRQTAVIKDLYKEYGPKGLKVLGVAVWDEPQATLDAIKKHDLPWTSWLNGQTIPTDVYGISGIPCIILFGPDGTILSRDKQDDALRADVAKYLAD